MAVQTQHWLKSEVVREALEMASRAMLGRYDIELRWGPNVCTDIVSYIELNPDLVINLDEPDWVKWILLKAQRDHEVGHQFTDASWRTKVTEPYRTSLRQSVACDLFNILEDARIELLQSLALPGCGPTLRFSNQVWFERLPQNSDLGDTPAYRQFLLGLVQQAVVGKMKGPLPDERANHAVRRSLPHIEAAKRAKNSNEVVEVTHQVMEYINDLLNEAEEESSHNEWYQPVAKTGWGSGTTQPTPPPELPRSMERQENTLRTEQGNSENHPEPADSFGGTEQKGAGSTDTQQEGKEVDEANDTDSGETNENAGREEERQSASTTQPQMNTPAGDMRESENNSRGDSESEDSGATKTPHDTKKLSDENDAPNNTSADTRTEQNQEGEGNAESSTTEFTNPVPPTTGHGGDENTYDDAQLLTIEQLEQLVEQSKMEVERLVEEHTKRESTLDSYDRDSGKEDEARAKAQELLRQEMNTKHSVAIHAGIQLEVFTPPDRLVDSNFLKEIPEMERVANRAKREVERVLLKAQASKKPRSRRKRGFLDDRVAYKAVAFNDPFVFKQRGKRSRDGGVVVGLLVDTSGSMFEDSRWWHARKAATVFSLILRGIKVPHFVAGFRSGDQNHTVIHEEYVSFHDCFSRRSVNTLQWIRYANDNRDGFSLRAAYESLATRHEKRKLLIVISDGRPNSYLYKGEAAIEDTRTAVQQAMHSGIATIGISIGNDHGHVPKIYRHYVLVPNVEQLTKEVAKVIEEAFR